MPILLKPFAGRSVLLYQKAARAENPIRCVEFENTTGLTLEGGPVTVLEQGSYVGEAMLDTLKPTEKRLVGYAVELAVRVLDNIDSHSDRVSRVTIRNGVLKTHYAQVQKTTYTFNSKSDKEQTCYLDHPRDELELEAGGDQQAARDHRELLAVQISTSAEHREQVRRPAATDTGAVAFPLRHHQQATRGLDQREVPRQGHREGAAGGAGTAAAGERDRGEAGPSQ